MTQETSQAAGAFEPVEIIEGSDAAGVIFVCDHASNALPPEYGTLGLAEAEFARHIAYDIGAGAVTRALAAAFGAPAVLTRYSRLLIDPNRGEDDPTLVMRLSDGSLIPGNARADAGEIASRIGRFWRPYRQACAARIEAMSAAGTVPAIVSIHSFTPVWRGTARPWQIGLLWDNDDRIAQPLIEALDREPGIVAGDNEPYDGALAGDTMYELGTARGLAHVLVEFRQDLVADAAGAAEWAGLVARLLQPVLSRPETHIIEHHGSRAGRWNKRRTLRRARDNDGFQRRPT